MTTSPTTGHPVTALVAPSAWALTSAGSALTPDAAAQAIAEGITSVIHDAEVTLAAVPDGTQDVAALIPGERITLPTTDATGALTEATYTLHRETRTAYVDLASVAGDVDAGDRGDTFGLGVLIADAASRRAQRIYIAAGGGRCVDGGTGVLVALSATPVDAAGRVLRKGAAGLSDLADLDTAKINAAAAAMDYELAVDAPAPVDTSHPGLAHLCDVAGVDATTPGYGAAGALAVGLHWLSGIIHPAAPRVRVRAGSGLLAEHLGFTQEASAFDLVVCSADLGGDLPATAATKQDLWTAGAQAASDYLRISTVQG
ncbi:glycerate kinase [Corynebacterium uterequi]|uniref:Glycerate kinase n=1 Tax=Corynebacterium uterequi TaxID=1072256 RepID=A0A0G3HDL5_9CORY|nr:glycerate kinase [Corynebacterium uterequi]AKK11404.1 glycerate kinase [Corynebacterium uterequi]